MVNDRGGTGGRGVGRRYDFTSFSPSHRCVKSTTLYCIVLNTTWYSHCMAVSITFERSRYLPMYLGSILMSWCRNY